MLYRYTVHPKGLDPFQAAKAWHLRSKEKLSWKTIRQQVRTADGGRPGRKALTEAVWRIDAQRNTAAFRRTGMPELKCHRCGRKQLCTVFGERRVA